MQPGAAGGPVSFAGAQSGPNSLDVDDIPGGRRSPQVLEWSDPSGPSKQSRLAGLLAVVALLATVASLYGMGTGFDTYITYAAGAMGFVSVLFGFVGAGRAARGEGGRMLSFIAIGAGFLAIGLNTYEFLYPHELYTLIFG